MKKLFLLLLVFPFLLSHLKAQEEEFEFGVLVVYNLEGYSNARVAINGISVFNSNVKSITYYKFFSSGVFLFDIVDLETGKAKSININLIANDTSYIRLETSGFGLGYVDPNTGEQRVASSHDWEILEKPKDQASKEISGENLKKLYIQENLSFPFFPNSVKRRFKKSEKKQGSGFLISKNKYIITNYHVVENSKKITVRGVNGNKNSSLSAIKIYSDSLADIAILKLEDRILLDDIPFAIGRNDVDIAENIYVLGYPLTTSMGEDIKLTNGLISSINGFMGDTNTYQISAPVQPGNSGGPLFDAKGNLMGIVNAKHKDADNVGYAIKISLLKRVLKDASVSDITIQSSTQLKTKSLTEQVKAIQNFVYIIDAE